MIYNFLKICLSLSEKTKNYMNKKCNLNFLKKFSALVDSFVFEKILCGLYRIKLKYAVSSVL